MFYDNFVYYCNKIGKSPSAAAIEMGFQKSVVTRWKKNKSTPTDANQQRIAEYFGISVEELMREKNKPIPETEDGLTAKDRRDIARDLEKMMNDLENSGDLMFDGDPASPEALESIRNALAMGLEYAKKVNKEKYTPKKYRKNKENNEE